MEKKDTISKILAIAGLVLVWIPILAPFIFGFVSLVTSGIFRFDYLMPAELGISVFIGGALLLWDAIRVKSQQGIVAWGLGIAAGSIFILNAFGDVEPGSLRWVIAVGLLITYSLMTLLMGVGGILLWRNLSKR